MILAEDLGRTVYQFRMVEGRGDHYPTKIAALVCQCGLRPWAAPGYFAIDAAATDEGWALACECGMRYYPAVPLPLSDETARFIGRLGAEAGGVGQVRGHTFSLLVAVLPQGEGWLGLAPGWRVTSGGRVWLAEEEAMLGLVEGRLLILWLAPGREAYVALRDMVTS